MIDCIIVGFNDYDFASYVDMVANGRDRGAFQDLRLSYIDDGVRPRRALDILTDLHRTARTPRPVFHNADFLWPVVTYLTTFLDRRGFSVEYINLFQAEKDRLRRLLAGPVRSVAITTTLYVSPHPVIEIIRFVRELAPDVTIIVGGPYVANTAAVAEGPKLETLFDYLGADVYVVTREGEAALAGVVDALRAGHSLRDIPNLVFREGDAFVHTPRDPESNPLSENMVDYGLFPRSAFNEFVTTRTAKSCPFACAFCGFPQRAGKYTYMPVSDVEKELDRIAEIPSVDTISFIDDTFNVPKTRFRELLQLMIDKRYRFKWNCYYRSDQGDRRTIEMMREAGCEGVFLGIESGSDDQLKRMNKTARRADYLGALKDFRDVGISTYASLIFGFPGETKETLAETESLLREAPPDFFRAQLWYCDPVTPIWQRREEFGITGRGFNWRHDTMTVEEACEHIERAFLAIDEPLWMPQFGFEQWSTFYLQRKGMEFDQVRAFVRAFNAIVREQVRSLRTRTIPPHLFTALEASCQFGEVGVRPSETLAVRA